jgi:uridine phosphorylase
VPPATAIHLRPTAPLAERVLLPGDPGRALELAQALLEGPRMFNHNRGLWGYTGAAPDGEPVTIQATGMGGPSAAIVLAELIALGARRAIRVGTCGALAPELGLGGLVIAREAICADGTSRALGAGKRVSADPGLTEALARHAPSALLGTVASVDLFYETVQHADTGADVRASREAGEGTRASGERHRGRAGHGDAVAIEMEAATLFALGAAAGARVACVLSVSDVFDARGARARIDDQALQAAAREMGRAAIAALSG